jgi:hypothetical protein
VLLLRCPNVPWPQVPYLVYWILAPVRVNVVLESLNFPFLVSLLGLIFAPWTLLMWTIIYPMNGWDWLWIGFAVMADVAAYIGTFHKRQSIPYYPANDPLNNM